MTELDLKLEDGPHAPQPAEDPLDILAAGFERRRKKQLALDQIATVPIDTWSTTDLITERERIQTVLDDAPPDRAADLTALARARRETEIDIADRRLEVAKLECRDVPRKQRHQHDLDLTTARSQLERAKQRAGQLDGEIAAVHDNQHRRASHLSAHHAERIELKEIDQVLDERLRTRTNQAVKDPPSYITRTLGPRPTDRTADRAWVGAVVEIEKNRLNHNITDHRTPLGPEPGDARTFNEWRRAGWAIEDTREAITPPVPTVGRAVAMRDVPSIDIGI